MGKKKDTAVVEEIVTEAREGFDLRARLAGIAKRERTVTVYTDEQTGEALGGVQTFYVQGTKLVDTVRRWGVLGKLDALREEAKELQKLDEVPDKAVADIKTRAAGLQEEAKALREKLEESALVFTLRALPELVMKDARRKAYRNLKLKAKDGLTKEQQEDLAEQYIAIALSASVASWTDNTDGKTRHALELDDALALKQFLLPEEWAKLEGALDELQARKTIGDAATADLDF